MQPKRLKYLYDRYVSGRITSAEYNELSEYITQNQTEEQLHDLIKETWNTTPLYKQSDDKADEIFRNILSHGELAIPKPRRVQVMLKRFAVAASIAVLAGLGWYFINKEQAATPRPSKNIMAAAQSQNRRYIQLPDGSRVVLNHGSTLTWSPAFNGKTREVYLTGEGYFDIQHLENKPFIVHTGSVATTVLGTAFNINAYQKNIIVTVTRGKVKVENNHHPVAIITPNQQVTVNADENASVKQTVNADKAVEWKQKELIFDDLPMEEIAVALEMQYNVSFSFTDTALKQKHVTVIFHNNETLDEMLNVITKVNGMHYARKGNEIIITPN
ncbi:FecR domain-containing protein [Danxiaibacter flavus]|uniref:FecR domain-containing protein n=1 Tax=Danxiaibacter flavus TaxID=3049108 RepID=A0ABV3ZCY1_9BACT|nr:FecR domain-containing protein [Chitinophagaceae bacterium DXS]